MATFLVPFHAEECPFDAEECNNLAEAWVQFAYSGPPSERYQNQSSQNCWYHRKLVGLSRVKQNFIAINGNARRRSASELDVQYLRILQEVKLFRNYYDHFDLDNSEEYAFNNANYFYSRYYRRLFPFPGCWEILKNYPDIGSRYNDYIVFV